MEQQPIDRMELGERLGRLSQAVETLSANVVTLTSQVREIENRISLSKGVGLGILLLSGGLGAAAVKAIEHLLHA